MFQMKLIVANVLLWLSLIPSTISFVVACLSPERAQQRVLKRILASRGMRQNEFEDHPITSYQDYEEVIRSLRETGSHPTIHEAVTRLCPTSGTSGENKLIPYTVSLKQGFQAGLYPWMFFLYLRFPRLFLRKQYWSVTPLCAPSITWPESVIPIGFEDDRAYIGTVQAFVTRYVWAHHPPQAHEETQSFLNRLATALSSETHLGLVSFWSPSLLGILVHEHGLRLTTGTVLSAWGHGRATEEAICLASELKVPFQAKGLLSTEACVTVPIGTKTFLVSLNSHYFEFRDIETGRLHQVTSLTEGKRYEVIVTTQSGFIRYATKDIVCVLKHVGKVPSCVFAGREHTLDLCGEKIDEATIERVVRELGGDLLVHQRFWFVAPTMTSERVPAYTLFTTTESLLPDLSGALEELLRRNYHYAYARDLGQLAKARVFRIEDTMAESTYLTKRALQDNARLGDVKMKHLDSSFGWDSVFFGRFL